MTIALESIREGYGEGFFVVNFRSKRRDNFKEVVQLVRDIITKSLDGNMLTEEEIASLFKVPLFSEESAMIIAASRKKSESASGGLAEVHAQVGLNIAPCPKNCAFCAFAARE